MSRRVVITGIGALTPIGKTANETWENAKKNKCGIDKITQFDTEGFKVTLAAEIKNYDPQDYFEKKVSRKLDLSSQYAIVAAREAYQDSGLDKYDALNRDRFGTILGNGIGGLKQHEIYCERYLEKGVRGISPFYIPMAISNLIPGNVAIELQANGICETITTACAASTNAMGSAYRQIKHGYQDVMISGGSEATISPLGIGGFQVMTACTTAEDKNRASIPFDKDRNGFVMGEGAAIFILEELEHAKKRGAKIYAEMVGFGSTCDANHITAPAEGGEGAIKAMKMAIEEAGIKPEQVDYINAHGTSTPLNDKTETQAIKGLFGEHAYKLSISSTKSMTGHLLGASGAVEGLMITMACKDNFVPATVNSKESSEDMDLDYTFGKGKEKTVNYAMSNSLGFGGHNSVILFKKYEG